MKEPFSIFNIYLILILTGFNWNPFTKVGYLILIILKSFFYELLSYFLSNDFNWWMIFYDYINLLLGGSLVYGAIDCIILWFYLWSFIKPVKESN